MGLPAKHTTAEAVQDKEMKAAERSASGDETLNHELTTSEHPRARYNTIQWIVMLVALLFAMFLFAMDNVIVADIQPAIVDSVGEIDRLPWVSVGYGLGATALTLTISKLFVSFDHKYLFISGVAIFEIGSAICGSAPNMTALIFGRVICGPGAAFLYLGINNLLIHLTTEQERPMYLGFVGLTWGLGTILGPVIGGAFTGSSATWRWSFYINLCVGAVIAPIYIFLLPSHNPRPGESIWKRVKEIDWLGTLLYAGAVVCLVMAISFGGSVYAWNGGQIIALLVVGGVLAIVFLLQQIFAIGTNEANRILPVEIARRWEMQILFLAVACASTIVFVPIYFIPLYYQFVRNETALQAAVFLIPFAVLNVFAIIFSGTLMSKIGYYMPFYLIGGILSTIGGALFFATIDVNTSTSKIYGYSVLCGFGSGLFVQAGIAVAQAKVQPKAVPLALSWLGCGQIFGITFALSLSSSIFLNLAVKNISEVLPTADRAVVLQTVTGVNGQLLTNLSATDRQNVLSALVHSINHVYPMVIVAGALVTVLSFVMPREKLFVPAPERKESDGEKT